MFTPRRKLAKIPILAVSTLLLAASSVYSQTAPSVTPLTNAQILQQLDPQMAVVVGVFDAIVGTPIIDLTPQTARQQFAAEDAAKIVARVTGKALKQMPIGKVIDGLTIEGPAGNQIPIRIYVPQGQGPFPVILYFHGGGFVIATIDTYDASPRALCDYADAVVVSIEYRKAPEAPFPAALNDAIASYKWVVGNIGKYDGVASKVALAGESAGGNLAAEVAIAARDQNLQRPTHQLLVYPETTSNLDQTSDILYTSTLLPLNTAALRYLDLLYVPNSAEDNNPDRAPINADLHNLAPATIVAADLDPLKSDGQDYAAKLSAAGNPVAYQVYPGTTHEFFGMGAVVDKAKSAEQFGAARIAASFK